MDRAATVVEHPAEGSSGGEREKKLLEKIGERTVERDLAQGLSAAWSFADRAFWSISK